jgi:diaminopimelate epimerase
MLQFEKWEGLGNDFVLVEQEITPERARVLCDRRRGIGADGVLIITRDPQPRMVVLNADGSRPEMCGNGLRCVVGYLAEGDSPEGELTLATDAGARRCGYRRSSAGIYDVTATMGEARLGDEVIVNTGADTRRFISVDVGNPHRVSFEPFEDELLDVVGPALERATVGGTNVELARVSNDGGRIDVIVWERGVGRTDACGTGACAVAAAAAKAGHTAFGRAVEVVLPGGPLSITVQPDSLAVSMRGPARRVFAGETAL